MAQSLSLLTWLISSVIGKVSDLSDQLLVGRFYLAKG